MSEYMEKHSVAKLIGAPPGYVGYDQGGILTDQIKKNPYTLLLLDEIEKAHHDINNILLQVMDSGKLTDSMGRVTDFSNVILIMTTNAGAIELESGQIGIKSTNLVDSKAKMAKIIKTSFTPEFRNRLDEIIYFKSLNHEMILRVVDKFIGNLREKLAKKSITLELTKEVLSWLATNGFSSRMGARPIQRLIDKRMGAIISKELLFGKLSQKMSIEVTISADDCLNFTYKEQ
jgi:ATP-dependent Clp protease ATP-binding subunit ClpA